MSLHHHIGRNQEGQALVEFALALPVLVLLLFSILHFGKAFNYWNDVTHLSAEGARFAVVNRKPDPADPASLQQQIKSQADTAELRSGGTATLAQPAQVCVDFPNSTSNAGDPVRVTMRFTYAWIPLIGNRIGAAQTTITSTSVMRLETLPTVFTAGCA